MIKLRSSADYTLGNTHLYTKVYCGKISARYCKNTVKFPKFGQYTVVCERNTNKFGTFKLNFQVYVINNDRSTKFDVFTINNFFSPQFPLSVANLMPLFCTFHKPSQYFPISCGDCKYC